MCLPVWSHLDVMTSSTTSVLVAPPVAWITMNDLSDLKSAPFMPGHLAMVNLCSKGSRGFRFNPILLGPIAMDSRKRIYSKGAVQKFYIRRCKTLL